MTRIRLINTDLFTSSSFGFLKIRVNPFNPRRLEAPTFGISVLLIVVSIR